MSFVPPLFKDFGKSVKDHFKKKYGDDKKATIKSSADGGNVNFESVVSFKDKESAYAGSMKVTQKVKGYGKGELELSTGGKAEGSFELNQLADGVKVKLSGTEKPSGEVNVDYVQDSFAASVKLALGDKTTANVSSAVGFEGLSVGGEVSLDTATQNVNEYNIGAQYAQKDFVFTVKTEDHADKVVTSYLHKVNHDLDVGARFSYNLANSNRLLTVGSAWKLDRTTFVKAKVSSDGIVETAVEQTVDSPSLTYTFSSKYNANNKSAVPTAFGLAFQFGDN